MFPFVNFSNRLRLPLFLVFVDFYVIVYLFSQSCQTCVRIRGFFFFLNVNKFKFTVAIHSCMSFEALKFICMHETVKFFSLVILCRDMI